MWRQRWPAAALDPTSLATSAEREILSLSQRFQQNPRIAYQWANLGHVPGSEPVTVGDMGPRMGVCEHEGQSMVAEC